MSIDDEVKTINKELSALYKKREKILSEAYFELIGTAYNVNGKYFCVSGIEKSDFVGISIDDGDVAKFTMPIAQVLQLKSCEIPKEDFVSLLKETHEFQLQTIGEEQ